ncbi:hypothetical protein [uncultured Robinsoniella sp.]|uniref:hypothetical protein n=1 Tax=uncultured Robinsoniella sp. TaxID=904190 RepID=UPI00374F9A03
MLYKKTGKLAKEKFENPSSEYRGAPFWAWNCKMDKEKVDNTLEELQQMGMGGGHIHCRTGMANEYLGEEFMDLVRYTDEEAKKRGMLTWLYDEDRWPSGAGGGIVTKEEQYRIRFLVFSPVSLEGKTEQFNQLSSSGQAVRSNNRRLLARYQVKIENGYLADYRMLNEDEEFNPKYQPWYAYLEISGDNPWFNNQAYLNTLDKAAVKRFVEVTHERYYEKMGDEFGKSIPGIFTDEPQFSHKTRLAFAKERKEVTIPFTDDLEDTYQAVYGHSLLAGLPELFWELGEGKFSVTRYQYHDHICERFTDAFADTIGDWCKDHDILLTGHMMEEPTLESQTAALGEAMRSYRSFTLPGIDMLCDRRELSTAKQAQSAARQYGRAGVISELYGVTNWDFDFRGHKLQGDWQAALGVTVRVPHLTWTSMAGEAKRDYPASIGYQSPWYKEYHYVEDYFARLNTALTRGKPSVKVGVIHPIESYWLYWGTEEHTGGIRREMDENFRNLIEWMLYGLVDFDFLAESLLPELTHGLQVNGKKLKAGEMEYETVIVPGCVTIRRSTLEILKKFQAQGGKVIFMGETARMVQVEPSSEVAELAGNCTCIPFNRNSLLQALEQERELDIRNEDGNRTGNLIYQMRNDDEGRWLFLAHVMPMANRDIPIEEKLTIRIRGNYIVTQYDALTGEIHPVDVLFENGDTLLEKNMFEHDSMLLYLKSAGMNKSASDADPEQVEVKDAVQEDCSREFLPLHLPEEVPVTLSEPNVYLLDMAQYRFDDGQWQEKEEILRIDNLFREKLGYPLRMEAFAQPWLDQEEENCEHKLFLRFIISSETELKKVSLALENGIDTLIYFNGEKMQGKRTGWYTDREIDVMELTGLKKGNNELMVEIPYNSKRNVEAMYLLGDFGVRVQGSSAVITEPVTSLFFGDITRQGLPFYGGNVTYHIPVETVEEAFLTLEATMYRNPVLKAAMDGIEAGYICYSPYRLELGWVNAGTHNIDLTAYGNRVNTFGTIHNCNRTEDWIGPNAWRTEGSSWAYEYQLRETGLLKAPVLTKKIAK